MAAPQAVTPDSIRVLIIVEVLGEHRQYLVRATYLEIYQEEVRDLLSKNPNQRLEVKESADKGVYVKGLVQFVVKSVAEINSVLQVSLPLQNVLFFNPYPSTVPTAHLWVHIQLRRSM